MVKRSGPSNLQLRMLLDELRERSVSSKLWKRVAKDLGKSSRSRRTVNLYKINKFARDGEIILVPGKVLSLGELDKKVQVAAFQFSDAAKAKITNAQGSIMTINELLAKNPEGKNVRILG